MTGKNQNDAIADATRQVSDLRDVLRNMQGGGTNTNKFTIGGNSFFHGVFVGFCVATCIATWVALVLGAMELHDLRAWRDIDHAKITKLEAKQ